MGEISRLFDFVVKQPIKENEVDAEFNQLVATVNDLDGANIATDSISNVQLANDSVTGVEIAAGAVGNTELAASVYSTWRPVFEHWGSTWSTVFGAGTWFFDGGQVFQSGVTGGASGHWRPFVLTAAHYAIAGRTTKLRMRVRGYANSIAPGVNFTVGLYPVTAVGGAVTGRSFTLGTVVAGSTVVLSLTADSNTGGVSTEFDFPADGNYMLGLNIPSTPASNHRTTMWAQLQVRWV